MNPGKLNKKITIEKYEKTIDGEGVEIMKWCELRTTFASFEDKIVRATTEDNATITQVETNMTIRKNYVSLFSSNIRVVYQNRIYEVLDICEVDDNYIKLITKGEKVYECKT